MGSERIPHFFVMFAFACVFFAGLKAFFKALLISLFVFSLFSHFSSFLYISEELRVFSAHFQAVVVDCPCLWPRGKLLRTTKKENFAPTPSTSTPSETFRLTGKTWESGIVPRRHRVYTSLEWRRPPAARNSKLPLVTPVCSIFSDFPFSSDLFRFAFLVFCSSDLLQFLPIGLLEQFRVNQRNPLLPTPSANPPSFPDPQKKGQTCQDNFGAIFV